MTTTTIDANAVFARAFHGVPNFMTPEILERGHAHGICWEISKGESVFDRGKPIYGVTFLRLDATRLDPDPSHCAFSLDEARELVTKVTETQ